MSEAILPTSSPGPARRVPRQLWPVIVFGLAIGGLVLLAAASFVALRAFGVIRFYTISASSMAPTINRDDSICVDAKTYQFARPVRGAVVVLRLDDVAGVPPETIYVRRVIGLPGERVQIADGHIFINRVLVPFRNQAGVIHFSHYLAHYLANDDAELTVPEDAYLVLGDSPATGFDSRQWGCVPARSVIGRPVFCYWPPHDWGTIY